MVKDEADVIETTISHMLGQVDRIVAIDNGSTDGTDEILQSLPVEFRRDEDPKHYQARKITAAARTAGGRYIVPFDADEVWYGTNGRTVREAIRQNGRGWIFVAEMFEHVPTDGAGANPFERMEYRKREPNPLQKVAAKRKDDLTFIEGAHSANYNGEYPATIRFKLEIRHFPYRSPSQFISKVRNGYNGRKATDLPEDVSPHFRRFGRMLEDGGEEALSEYFWSNIYRETSDPELVRDPCPL